MQPMLSVRLQRAVDTIPALYQVYAIAVLSSTFFTPSPYVYHHQM